MVPAGSRTRRQSARPALVPSPLPYVLAREAWEREGWAHFCTPSTAEVCDSRQVHLPRAEALMRTAYLSFAQCAAALSTEGAQRCQFALAAALRGSSRARRNWLKRIACAT